MVKEAVLWWRKQCNGIVKRKQCYGEGSSAMVEEVMLRKQCYGGGSNVMMKEAVSW